MSNSSAGKTKPHRTIDFDPNNYNESLAWPIILAPLDVYATHISTLTKNMIIDPWLRGVPIFQNKCAGWTKNHGEPWGIWRETHLSVIKKRSRTVKDAKSWVGTEKSGATCGMVPHTILRVRGGGCVQDVRWDWARRIRHWCKHYLLARFSTVCFLSNFEAC